MTTKAPDAVGEMLELMDRITTAAWYHRDQDLEAASIDLKDHIVAFVTQRDRLAAEVAAMRENIEAREVVVEAAIEFQRRYRSNDGGQFTEAKLQLSNAVDIYTDYRAATAPPDGGDPT